VLIYGGVARDPNAFEIAEHCLREIAMFTMTQPRYQPPGYQPPAPALHPNDLADAMRKAVKGISESLRSLRLGREADPVAVERASQRRLQRAIEAERKKGLAFVRDEARRVRAELGLTEPTYTRKDLS
jgi:hypothetical protein